jgi:hypothetical protein
MHGDELLKDHPANQRARREVLSRFKALGWPDQYRIYEFVQGHFIHSGPGSERQREIRERADCVKAVQQVAKHLGLPEGEAPGVEAYKRVSSELGIEPSAATIIRRWGAWREVCKAARGEKVSMTARQRARFRAAIRQKPSGEEWLAGAREWLSEKPPTLYASDYNAWAEERNEQKPHLARVSRAEGAVRSLVLPWSAIVKVAQREISLADAQERELERLKAKDGVFVSSAAIALIHGVTSTQVEGITRSDGFPNHAFTIRMGLRTSRIWHLSDVEAHHKGEPFPERVPGGLQHQIMTREEICKVCGLTVSALIYALSRGHQAAPRPAGCVIRNRYWFRISVEAWADATGNQDALTKLLARDDAGI